MHPLTEIDIRNSFINCSKGETKRIGIPSGFDAVAWDEIDFLGWPDPQRSGRCYVVAPHRDEPTGIVLKHESGGSRKPQMCHLCRTTHSAGGVSLMVAPKGGAAGKQGNSVGIYMCSDLSCSLYARDKKVPSLGRRYRENLSLEAKVERLRDNVAAFIDRVAS